MSFPAITVQFIFTDELHITPVSMAVAFSIVSLPWCVKPFYGFLSDKFSLFDWGRRRPYIAYSGLFASYIYLSVGRVISDLYATVAMLTAASLLICISDVCADSITVELVKGEKEKGVLQSNNWIARACGALFGAILGGMAYEKLGADAVFKITAIVPLLMSFVVWKLPKSDGPTVDSVWESLWDNVFEQKKLVFILFFITIPPNYGSFYTYFLRHDLGYSPVDFTWLSMASSLSFLSGVVSYRFYFRYKNPETVLRTAIWVATLCRLTQLFVVTGVYNSFTLVLLDGVAESFCGQLLMMPLIVYTAQQCNDGVEGSLFALMMSVSNISNVLADELGALLSAMYNVTESTFGNLVYVMSISILLDLIVPLWAVRKMFSASSNEEIEVHLEELDMIDLNEEMYPPYHDERSGHTNSDNSHNQGRPRGTAVDTRPDSVDHTRATPTDTSQGHTLATANDTSQGHTRATANDTRQDYRGRTWEKSHRILSHLEYREREQLEQTLELV
jgi:Na+/melibiose symporter-like transporter